jgi:hypothetical protein
MPLVVACGGVKNKLFDHIDHAISSKFFQSGGKLSSYHAMHGCFVDSTIVKSNRLLKKQQKLIDQLGAALEIHDKT